MIDFHRQRRRTPEVAPPVEGGRTASQEIVAAVNEALARLLDLDRDVFLMREVAGLGYEEIAAACDLTAPAMRSRLHRARTELRNLLAAPISTTRMVPMRLVDRRRPLKDL